MPARALAALLIATCLVVATIGLRAEPSPGTADRIAALIASGDLADADTVVGEWLDRATRSAEPLAIAEASHSLGTLRVAQRRFAEAERAFDTAQQQYASAATSSASSRGLGRVWRDLGSLYWTTGRTADISAAYLEAARAFAVAGLVHDQAGALRSSIYGQAYRTGQEKRAVLLEALALLAGRPDQVASHRYVRGALLHDLGDRMFAEGRYADAHAVYAAADGLLAPDEENRRAYSLLLTSRARLLRAQGQPARAIALYERALVLQRATRYDHGLSQTLNAMAVAHGTLGQRAQAVASLEQALAVAQRLDAAWRVAVARLNLAEARLAAGQRTAALAEFSRYEADASRATLGPGYRLQEIPLLLAASRLNEALDVATLVLAGNASRAGVRELRARALMARAEVYERLGDMARARHDLDEARDVWEAVRASLEPSDFVRRGFAEMMATDFYASYVDGLADTAAPAASLAAAELARTRAFVDLLAQRVLTDGLPEPTPLDGTAAPDATTSLTEIERRLLGSTGAVSGPPVDAALESARRVTPLTVTEMQRLVEAERVVSLVYWVGATRTLLWILEPATPVALHVIEAGAPQLARLVQQSGETQDGGALRRLDALLLAPAARALTRTPRLLVVPHGPLNRLSFATVRDARGRYLVERASVRYLPSLTSLETIRRRQVAASTTRRALVVGVPNAAPRPSGGVPLPALPGVRRETAAVRAALTARGTDAETLVGAGATESAVRAALARGRHDVVHVAAHGVVSDRDPMASWLAFSGGGAASADDGRLTAAEVYGLRLDTDLVVLSACRGADGPVSGDGVTGLTRAFLAAGSRSVLASLWTVPDTTAPQLLSGFYARWRDVSAVEGTAQDKAESLRHAQRRLLAALRGGHVSVDTRLGRMPLAEHPLLWGGLIVVGDR